MERRLRSKERIKVLGDEKIEIKEGLKKKEKIKEN